MAPRGDVVRSLKDLTRRRLPAVVTLRRQLHLARLTSRHGGDGHQSLFAHYYRENVWHDEHSRSGPGSTMEQTAEIRRQLPVIFDELAICSVVDAPCGDFNWISHVVDELTSYVGCDIVDELVDELAQRHARAGVRFQRLNIVEDVPPVADAIVSRDSLVHFSFADALSALDRFKASGSRYLITTTFTDRRRNSDIRTGSWRPLNLERPPFDFPPPLRLINEHCTEDQGRWGDKALGVWLLADLPLGHRGV